MQPESTYYPTYPAPSPKAKHTMALVLLSMFVVALLVAFLIVYTTVAPARQVAKYVKAVKANQSQLSSKIDKVETILDDKSLTDPNTSLDQTEKDVKEGKAILKSAQQALDDTKKNASDLQPLPLSSWNNKYKQAESLKTNEQAYLKASQQYVNDMTAIVDFLDKSAQLQRAASNASQPIGMEELLGGNLSEYGKHLSTILQDAQKGFEAYQKLSVPEPLKDIYNLDVESTKQVIGFLTKEAAAASANDLKGVIGAELDEANYLSIEDPALEAKYKDFSENSSLRETSSHLRDLNAKITNQVKKL